MALRYVIEETVDGRLKYSQNSDEFVEDDYKSVYNSLFGFCTCVNSGDNIDYIYEVLKSLEKWKEESVGYKEYMDIMRPITGSDRSTYFILYELDRLGLSEHGNSINLSHLTEDGKNFIKNLEKE